MLLHSLGIAALAAVDSTQDLPILILAYALMGTGGGMGANTAQTTALMDFDGAQTHKASVLWNINRQMAFSVGAALLLMLFNLLAQRWSAPQAYHLTFAIAALLGLLPLLPLRSLPAEKTHHE
jgi:MFS family permease